MRCSLTSTAILLLVLRCTHVLGAPRSRPLPTASASPKAAKKGIQAELDGIVAVIPAGGPHNEMAMRASRHWRKGIKAVYVAELPPTNERIAEGRQHNEFWGDYPDIWDEPWGRVHRPFDSRAAMAPFVAHQLLKREGVDYKWLLYGDDDTMWFLSAVADLLRDYDSDLPYFISDMYYFSAPPDQMNWRNGMLLEGATRCLPCNVTIPDEPWPLGHNWVPPVGCPCTKELLCDKDYRMWEFVREPVGEWSKHNCTAPWEDDEGDYYKKWMYSIDGGSGAILSKGLMEAIDHQEMERCIRNHFVVYGGDALISHCIWSAGYGMTQPIQSYFKPHVQMFDLGRWERRPLMNLLVDATEGNCNELCQAQAKWQVSKHIRSRYFNNLDATEAYIKGISHLHDTYLIRVGHPLCAESKHPPCGLYS